MVGRESIVVEKPKEEFNLIRGLAFPNPMEFFGGVLGC